MLVLGWVQTACQQHCACSESKPGNACMQRGSVSMRPSRTSLLRGTPQEQSVTRVAPRQPSERLSWTRRGQTLMLCPSRGQDWRAGCLALTDLCLGQRVGISCQSLKDCRGMHCVLSSKSSCGLASGLSSTQANCNCECLYFPLSFPGCCIHHPGKPVCAASYLATQFVSVPFYDLHKTD